MTQRVCSKWFMLITILSACGSESNQENEELMGAGEATASAVTTEDCSTQIRLVGDFAKPGNKYQISAWKSEFLGRGCRRFDPAAAAKPWLQINLAQTSGGYDSTMVFVDPQSVLANRADPTKREHVSFRVASNKITGKGDWWYGAKVIITQQKKWTDLNNNYENYVIENTKSNIEPTKLQKRFPYLTPRGSSSHGGATYYHYTGKLVVSSSFVINQVISIRAKPRTSGTIPVGEIKQKWLQSGWVKGNYYNQGWRLFIETSGDNHGSILFDNISVPSLLW